MRVLNGRRCRWRGGLLGRAVGIYLASGSWTARSEGVSSPELGRSALKAERGSAGSVEEGSRTPHWSGSVPASDLIASASASAVSDGTQVPSHKDAPNPLVQGRSVASVVRRRSVLLIVSGAEQSRIGGDRVVHEVYAL